MKKYLITIIIGIITTTAVCAQGNLQFNRVVNFGYSFNQSNYDVQTFSSLIVVPAGKVLKIESASVRKSSSTTLGYASGNLAVGDQLLWAFPLSSDGINLFPIWLSEGSYDVQWDSSPTSLSLSFNYSAIEFNIVP